MTKIAFFGHKELFLFENADYAARRVDDMVVVSKRHYGDDLIILSGGSPGVQLLVGESARKHRVKYELYLPCHPEVFSMYWNDDQKNSLKMQFESRLCNGNFIDGSVCKSETLKNRREAMIKDCNMVFVFWVGKKRGETYEAIKYAVESGKQVFNVYNENVVLLDVDDL